VKSFFQGLVTTFFESSNSLKFNINIIQNQTLW